MCDVYRFIIVTSPYLATSAPHYCYFTVPHHQCSTLLLLHRTSPPELHIIVTSPYLATRAPHSCLTACYFISQTHGPVPVTCTAVHYFISQTHGPVPVTC